MQENQIKLLSSSEQELLTTQLKDLMQVIEESKKQLTAIDQKIDQLQPNYILVEGYMKLIVLNHIKNIQYNNDHNPGYIINPETMKIIQNVHYCVNNNLPINRINLYEVMPEYFQAQIGQLQQSVRRLIEQKKLYLEDDTANIRFFYKTQQRDPLLDDDQMDVHQLLQQKDQYQIQVTNHFNQIIIGHDDLLQRVSSKQTPFRNIDHFNYVLTSNLPIKLLPEQQAYKKDLQYMIDVWKSFEEYDKQVQQLFEDAKYNYVDPPPYVARHPVLMKKWQQMMVKYTNPVPIQNILPDGDMREVLLGQKMEEGIRKIVAQKYDKEFVQMMNTDRSKIDNKKLQIQFLNLSTNVMEDLKQLPEYSSPQEQIFEKLPNTAPWLLTNRKKTLIKLDQLTRILYLNHKDSKKYSLQFFAKWFGIDQKQLKDVLNTFSYLKVKSNYKEDFENATKKQLEYQILKFIV